MVSDRHIFNIKKQAKEEITHFMRKSDEPATDMLLNEWRDYLVALCGLKAMTQHVRLDKYTLLSKSKKARIQKEIDKIKALIDGKNI